MSSSISSKAWMMFSSMTPSENDHKTHYFLIFYPTVIYHWFYFALAKYSELYKHSLTQQPALMLSHQLQEPEGLPSRGGREEVLFKNRLQSIKDFIEKLDNDPQEAQSAEKQWEKCFYKDQLKVALNINHLLIKIVGEKQQEIQEIFKQFGQLQRKVHKLTSEKNEFCQNNNITDENSQRQINKNVITPKRKIKEAFDAQRKILGAKYSQQKEQYDKMIEKKEEILKSSKEQNAYLIQKMFFLSERLTVFDQEKKSLKKENKNLKNTILELRKKILGDESDCVKVLQFSPIQIQNQQNQEEILAFSFNQSNLSYGQDDELRKQVQDLKELLRIQEEQYSELEKQILVFSKNHHFQDLERYCTELKRQLHEKIEEIQQYKAIFAETNEKQEKIRTLATVNDDLSEKLMKADSQLINLRGQVEAIVSFELSQQQEWHKFFQQSGIKQPQ